MKRKFSPRTILVTLLLAAVFLFGGAWSVASAAVDAQPGDAFYPVRVLWEKAGAIITQDTPLEDIDDGAVDDGDDGTVNDGDNGEGNN